MYKSIGIETVVSQIKALESLKTKILGSFNQVIDIILNCEGHVIVCGVGKSGLVGQKMVATYASTGTPSFFIHPTEAFHGDLGMIKSNDVVILISYSGETDEVNKLIPSLKSFGNKIIAMTGGIYSTLARHADVVLDISVDREACPNNLAPTTSTLVTMALGDALAVALIKARDFQPIDFARFHPGGSLGRRLLCKVADEMHYILPKVTAKASLHECLLTMTEGKVGVALVFDGEDLIGIITDGDIRRALVKHGTSAEFDAGLLMTSNPHTVLDTCYVVDAEAYMKKNKIHSLIVLDADKLSVIGLFEHA